MENKTNKTIQPVKDDQAIAPLEAIRVNTSAIAAVVEKIFNSGSFEDSRPVGILKKIDNSTSRLLEAAFRPDNENKTNFKLQERSKVIKESQAASPLIGRYIRSIDNPVDVQSTGILSAITSSMPATVQRASRQKSDNEGNQTSVSGIALKDQKQEKAGKQEGRQERGLIAKILAIGGGLKHGAIGVAKTAESNSFLEALTGPIGGIYKEAKSIMSDVGDAYGGVKKSVSSAHDWYNKKAGNASREKTAKITSDSNRDEKGRFLKQTAKKPVQDKPAIKRQLAIAKAEAVRDNKSMGILSGINDDVKTTNAFELESQKTDRKMLKELKNTGGAGGDGEDSGLLSFLGGAAGSAGIVGTLTGGLGISGLLTAGVGTIFAGGAGILAGITGAVLVGLAGAGGAVVGTIINSAITKSLGGQSLGEWLFDKTHAGDKEAKDAEKVSVNQDYGQLGSVSAKYESGQGGAGEISSGKGDKGGKSYGTYQLSSKEGTLGEFLKSSEYGAQFAGLEQGSAAFDQKWKQIAESDPNFGKAQHNFIGKTYYTPAVNELKKEGLDAGSRSRGIQEMIWSKANQYGAKGGSTLIKNALKDTNIASTSDAHIIKTVAAYERSRATENFKGSAPQIGGIIRRMKEEEATNLSLSGTYGDMVKGNIPKPPPEPRIIPGTTIDPEPIRPQTIKKTSEQAAIEEIRAKTYGDYLKNSGQTPGKTSSGANDDKSIKPYKNNDAKPIETNVNQIPSEFDDITLAKIRWDFF